MESEEVSSTVGLTKELKSNVSFLVVCSGSGASVCCVVVVGMETLTVLKFDMATTCLTSSSSVCIRSERARFSKISRSISEDGTSWCIVGSSLSTGSSVSA